MTKIHESLVVGPIPDVLAGLPSPRGEFTIVLAGARTSDPPPEVPSESDLLREFGLLTETGLSRRASIRSLAAKYDVPSRQVYQALETARDRN
jgi:16S rRNA C1402 (ribose-2'-O) methylase RsmI